MTPRLLYSELGHRVYVVTRYRVKDGILIASQKHDVTSDVPRMLAQWKLGERRAKRRQRAQDGSRP